MERKDSYGRNINWYFRSNDRKKGGDNENIWERNYRNRKMGDWIDEIRKRNWRSNKRNMDGRKKDKR